MHYKEAYTLRPYQLDIYNKIPILLAKLGSVMVQAPPRSGKSKIIDATVQRILKEGKIPLVLSHRDKIQKQLIEHCSGISIDSSTGNIGIFEGRCYVAMTQSLINRPNIIAQLLSYGKKVVIIIDEMHVGDFCKILDLFPLALRIGFSATPTWKLSKWITDYYKGFIAGPQVKELIAWGNIVPVDYHEMVSDLDGLKANGKGEFTESSQDIVFGKSKIYDGLFEEIVKFKVNKWAIFCASKKSADNLFLEFSKHNLPNINPVVYYSGKPDYELAKFTDLGLANVLITVRSLGTGWDYPPLDGLILWCAMGSLNSFYQTVFRNRTPYPEKNLATTLDFGGNNTRFGGNKNRQACTMDRDWEVLSSPTPQMEKLSNGVAPIKICPACEFMLSAMARSCCNCGFIYPIAEIELKQGELIKIEEGLEEVRTAVGALTGKRIADLSAAELALYAKEKNKKTFCMRVARAQQLLQPNFAFQYGKAMSYKGSWADRVLREQAEILMYEPNYKIHFANILI